MELEGIILAGGLGTRLRSVLGDMPKVMAPVAGRPFLEHILEHLDRQGFCRIILAVGYKREVVRDYFGDRFRNIRLCYSAEEEPLGTGGAIKQALTVTESKHCFILNGDTWVRLDFGSVLETHIEDGSTITIVVNRVPDVGRYGAVEVSGNRITEFYEKGYSGPGYINAGVYLVSPDIFSGYRLPDSFSFERDFLSPNIKKILPCAFKNEGEFIDIGIPEDYEHVQKAFRITERPT